MTQTNSWLLSVRPHTRLERLLAEDSKMQAILFVVYLVHVLVSLFLILVVLLQQGKGADLAVFGGGSTQAAFGARSATTLLHKLTVGGFIIFIFTTMSIAILQTRGSSGASVVGATAAAAAAANTPDEASDAVDSATDAAATANGAMNDSLADDDSAAPAGDAATASDAMPAETSDTNNAATAPEEDNDG